LIERYGNTRQSTKYSCTYCGCRLETGETFDHGAAWNIRENYSDESIENYERFLDAAHKRWGRITIDASIARTMADWIEKGENLDLVVKCVRDLCDLVECEEKQTDDRILLS
jgi:hypothetical protein